MFCQRNINDCIKVQASLPPPPFLTDYCMTSHPYINQKSNAMSFDFRFSWGFLYAGYILIVAILLTLIMKSDEFIYHTSHSVMFFLFYLYGISLVSYIFQKKHSCFHLWTYNKSGFKHPWYCHKQNFLSCGGERIWPGGFRQPSYRS